jgi:hypothetical protein
MGWGCKITKHLKRAHRHIFYYSNVFDVGICLYEKKWLDDGFMKGYFFLHFRKYGIEGWE